MKGLRSRSEVSYLLGAMVIVTSPFWIAVIYEECAALLEVWGG